jgi:cellulose 1,4-beta-cellobiosidase
MQISTRPILQILVGMLGVLLPSAALAQTHVDNPYVGATVYANPDYTAKVQTSIAQTTDSALKTKMQAVGQTPTFVWLDRIAAIAGSATESGLQKHLDNALAQRQGSTPIIAQFVIYDLPGRDCHALASNGEIPLTAAGLAQYKTSYIDAIVNIMKLPQYSGIRIVTVIEPDSLPNLVTNLNDPDCGLANSSGIYFQATQYAINQLHTLPNVYMYLDLGHSGWLGWPTNSSGAVSVFTQMIDGTTAKRNSVDGFVTDTANTTPLLEPFMTASQPINGQPVMNSTFYQFNPNIDEVNFTADMYARFTQAGWPTSIGFLIDTSRNGWGGPNRPTGASTSTDLNTFVNATRIDPRPHRGLWCNQDGAGLGERPQATPPGFPSSHLDAFVWVKPPGDSDGSSSLIPNDEGKGFDRFCDPTFTTPDGTLTNALPNAPISGHWFHTQFVQLVTNAFPPVGGGPPPPVCTTAPPAPTAFSAAAVSSSQINLSWNAVPPPANCSVSYTLHRSTTANFTPSAATQIGSGLTATTFSDPGRAASTTYFYAVLAVDAAGGSALARTQATTPGGGGCTTAPPAPASVTATATSSSQINLSWSAVPPPANCSVSYTVHRSTTANFTPSGTTQIATGLTTTSLSDPGRTAATTYFYAVVAADAAGNSPPTRAQATTPPASGGGGTCHVGYTVTNFWNSGFQVALSIQNTGTAPLNGWILTWTFPAGESIASLWNGAATQTGQAVTVNNMPYNGTIAAGASYNDVGFVGNFNNPNNIAPPVPTSFSINGVVCN